MASVEKMKDVVHRQLKAFCDGDWSTYKQLLADGAVYEEEATTRRITGADEIVRAVQPWKNAFPDMGFKLKEAIGSGDAVVCEVEWTGTHKGALIGKMGNIPPTGKTARVPAVLVVRFDGERIRESRHYFDLLSLLAQLGITPQLGATASR